MRTVIITLGILALPMSALGQIQNKEMVIEPSPKQLNALQSLSPADVAARVVINDDDLEPVATLTTAAAYSSRGAFTDRRTGQALGAVSLTRTRLSTMHLGLWD